MPARKTKTAAKKSPGAAKQIIGARNGVKITLDDAAGKKLTLETPAGHNITLSDRPLVIHITDSSGNEIKLEPSGITILAAARVSLFASDLKIKASAVSIDAGTTRFTGLVQCDSLVTNSVVSASYSPGAGNIW